MLSVIVLERDLREDRLRPETVVRSLGWLVSAVVAGVVRDVVLTASRTMDLQGIADVTGCEFVQADDEPGRLQGALQLTRSERVLVLSAGYHADAYLTEELDRFERDAAPEASALVLRQGRSILDTVAPVRRRIVAVLVSRERCRDVATFNELQRICRTGTRLSAQLRPII